MQNSLQDAGGGKGGKNGKVAHRGGAKKTPWLTRSGAKGAKLKTFHIVKTW
jgi:hypothetical protein